MTAPSNAVDGLEELALACERATGPDREIDLAIWRIVDPRAAEIEAKGRAPLPWLHCYTASLDAAMTLIPAKLDGLGERLRLEVYDTPGVLAEHVRASAWVPGAARVYAATPALAICASALRSRALAPEQNP